MKSTTHHKKSKIGKRIALGIFFTLGTLIILLAIFSLTSIFFSGTISNRALTNSADEFIALYNQNDMERDLPDDLAVTEASCLIEEDTYTLNVTVLNTGSRTQNLQLQIYYPEEFEKDHRGIVNPFVRISEEDGLILKSGEEKSFTMKGTYSETPEELQENLSCLYFEAIFGISQGRILLPVTFDGVN